jgi:hypothetical protein
MRRGRTIDGPFGPHNEPCWDCIIDVLMRSGSEYDAELAAELAAELRTVRERVVFPVALGHLGTMKPGSEQRVRHAEQTCRRQQHRC